jgi:hypothetical protein
VFATVTIINMVVTVIAIALIPDGKRRIAGTPSSYS